MILALDKKHSNPCVFCMSDDLPPNGGPNGLAKTIKIAFVLLQKYGAIFAPRLRRVLFLKRKERNAT